MTGEYLLDANIDIWIVAVARQHGLTLVSRDAHFQQIEGLLVEAW